MRHFAQGVCELNLPAELFHVSYRRNGWSISHHFHLPRGVFSYYEGANQHLKRANDRSGLPLRKERASREQEVQPVPQDDVVL